MKTILIKPKGGRIISAILVVFFILFLLPIVFIYTHTSEGKTFLLAFMAFAALLFVAGFYFQRTILKQAKKSGKSALHGEHLRKWYFIPGRT